MDLQVAVSAADAPAGRDQTVGAIGAGIREVVVVAQQTTEAGLGLTQMPCERKTVSFSIQRKVSGQVCGGLSVDAQL